MYIATGIFLGEHTLGILSSQIWYSFFSTETLIEPVDILSGNFKNWLAWLTGNGDYFANLKSGFHPMSIYNSEWLVHQSLKPEYSHKLKCQAIARD